MENAIPNRYQITPKVTSDLLDVILSLFSPYLSEHFSSVFLSGSFISICAP